MQFKACLEKQTRQLNIVLASPFFPTFPLPLNKFTSLSTCTYTPTDTFLTVENLHPLSSSPDFIH